MLRNSAPASPLGISEESECRRPCQQQQVWGWEAGISPPLVLGLCSCASCVSPSRFGISPARDLAGSSPGVSWVPRSAPANAPWQVPHRGRADPADALPAGRRGGRGNRQELDVEQTDAYSRGATGLPAPLCHPTRGRAKWVCPLSPQQDG